MIDSFWLVKVYGYPYRVTAETAAAIRKAIEEMRLAKVRDNTVVPFLLPCQDIFNTPLYLDIKGVNAMYLSTPELRESEDQHTRYLNKPSSFE